MTKADLVQTVSHSAELNKADTEVVIDAILKQIVEALSRGEAIEVRGFGSFRRQGPQFVSSHKRLGILLASIYNAS